MYRIIGRLLLVVGTSLIAFAARAELITVTVTGDVVVAPADLSGVSVGTPYTWTATYDSSIASSPIPYLGNTAEANSVLSTSLTIGSYSWTGGNLRMAIACCSSIPSSYYDTVAFYADSMSGPSVTAPSETFAPADLNYLFDKPANVLPSTATPSAAELALLPPSVFDFQLRSTSNFFDEIDILGGGNSPQRVTISSASAPEPATLGLFVVGFGVLAVWGSQRRRSAFARPICTP
jgi:hypothetical protein